MPPRSIRVLIADPDADCRRRIVGAVEQAARELEILVKIDQAADGTTALALWGDHKPDLVVCEVLLEGVSGLELLRRVRDHGGQRGGDHGAQRGGDHGAQRGGDHGAQRGGDHGAQRLGGDHAAPQFVLVTSLARDVDRYWGLRNGAHAYVPKPFDDGNLRARVRKLLESGPSATPEAP